MQQPLAIAVIGGLITNMLLTRLLIPVGYLVFRDNREAARRMMSSSTGPLGSRRWPESLSWKIRSGTWTVSGAAWRPRAMKSPSPRPGRKGSRWRPAEAIDAIVLDLMLPGRDGMGVLRELRSSGFAKPILILSARDAVEDRVQGLDEGANDYLVKPFAFAEFLARLRALLAATSRAGSWSFGPATWRWICSAVGSLAPESSSS